MSKHLVVALAYDQLCTFEFGCVVEMFALERPELDVDWYRFAVCADERGPIRGRGGITVATSHSLAILSRADTIIIPGWRDATEPLSPQLMRRLRAAHARGARIASICSGVFVLAAAGLLNGRAATTHWRYVNLLQERYPAIEVRPNALYVDEGQIITSAGSAAGLDMMLHLVRRDHGTKVANRVAQRLVIPPFRLGDQAQFVKQPMRSEDTARLGRLQDWVRGNPTLPHCVASMARRAAMSPRTLQRQFQESTGLSPVAWLTRERVEIAKELLESTREPVTRVAALAGFGSEESFRRHFRLVAGTTPTAFRNQFGGSAR